MMSSSVARGLEPPPPLACEVCKIAPFWWFWGRFFVKNWKQPPPIGKQPPLKRLDFRFRPKNQSQIRWRPFFLFLETKWFWAEKTFEFPISAEKSVNFGETFFFWRPPNFGRKQPLNFRAFREISSQFSDKPCETDSRTMKIRVKVVCTLLTLSK